MILLSLLSIIGSFLTYRLSSVNSPLAKLVGQLYSILGPGLHENLSLGSVRLLVSAELIPERDLWLLSTDNSKSSKMREDCLTLHMYPQ